LSRLLHLIPKLPEEEMLAEIYRLRGNSLALLALQNAFGPKECDCPLRLRPCGCVAMRAVLDREDHARDKLEAIRNLNRRFENPAVADLLPPPLWEVRESKLKKVLRRLQRLLGRRTCDCPIGPRLIPCRHVLQPESNALPPAAHALIGALLWPDPPPPIHQSPVLLRSAKVQDLIERAEAGMGLWHNADALRRRAPRELDPDEALQAERDVWCAQSNGAACFGSFRRRRKREDLP
jgi:hypothetical protein